MKIIAAVDEKWGIGKGMNLLFRISEDMEFFKEKTMGKPVVMGRKTLESFPNAKPLKNRKNVVLTTDKNFKCDGTEIVHGIKTIVEKYGGDDTFVIGGGEVYKQLLPYCDSAYITKVFSTAMPMSLSTILMKMRCGSSVMCPKNTLKTAFRLCSALI